MAFKGILFTSTYSIPYLSPEETKMRIPASQNWKWRERNNNFCFCREAWDSLRWYLNHLVIATRDNTQLLVGMSKCNVVNTTNMGINLKDGTSESIACIKPLIGPNKFRIQNIPLGAALVHQLDCKYKHEQYVLKMQHLDVQNWIRTTE